ncbi:hypothetical protein [Haladaptatus sp. CMSO5]|uniref:hypothetical protein n=1 Tax=Haladaptatus sp. CMSO5 TaxID=3120514 RepID=UPI002FCDFF67
MDLLTHVITRNVDGNARPVLPEKYDIATEPAYTPDHEPRPDARLAQKRQLPSIEQCEDSGNSGVRHTRDNGNSGVTMVLRRFGELENITNDDGGMWGYSEGCPPPTIVSAVVWREIARDNEKVLGGHTHPIVSAVFEREEEGV